jgi:hypothetical protein
MAVELGLAGFEDGAHSALADEFEDFKLGQCGGDGLARRGWGP